MLSQKVKKTLKSKRISSESRLSFNLSSSLPQGLNLLFLSLAIIGSLHISIMSLFEVQRLLQRRENIAKLEQQLQTLTQQIEGDRLRLEHAQDPRYLEHLIRQQGFIYPQERLIITKDTKEP
ncbi:MAG: hypothetical protein R2880_06930 [Deinococcales bacterium]